MVRQDEGLAFMLRYENIAWYEDGAVRILDRRIYPAKTEFVTCSTHEEVAKAIKDMVTQSAGPYTAAPMGMALAAWECRDMKPEAGLEYLKKAAYTIAHARPTTAKRMEIVCGEAYKAAEKAILEGRDASLAVRDRVIEMNDERYAQIGRIAEHLVERFPDKGAVMTHCFAETIIGMMLKECKKRGKDIRLFCPETRPFFQGARLTATCCRDMGFDVTVITDNMAAFVMKKEGIDVFTTAADAICCDGHVVNKVGTLQNAISAKYFGIPYYVTGAPDPGHPTVDTVTIEMRDPEESLMAMGVRTAAEGVRGYYPAFDVTPPELVSGVVTDLGVFSPFELAAYFKAAGEGRNRVVV
ncbi:MAG: S-methyl-5-thioribose-1-phosphate isomerase [Firmicutes bacterium]|nr:S-methyl-5-thioribose-1-phosphate isomerase [Bacillota bacterium]